MPRTRSQTTRNNAYGIRRGLQLLGTLGMAGLNTPSSSRRSSVQSSSSGGSMISQLLGAFSPLPRRPARIYKGAVAKKKAKTFKRKIVKPFVPKQKKTKFAKKVQKVLNGNQPCAITAIRVYQQIRQTNAFQTAYNEIDENGYRYIMGSHRDIQHLASIAFNDKPIGSNIDSLTDNLDDKAIIFVQHYNVNVFFKSTSNHVVNVEMYECWAKNNQNDSAQVDMGDSIVSTMRNSMTNSVNNIDFKPEYAMELTTNWTVKKHVFKLGPGEHATKNILIAKNRKYDLGKMLDRGVPWTFPKGCCNIFFRVWNDPTVSATTGDIHFWNSSTVGGVAMTMKRTAKIRFDPGTMFDQYGTPGVFLFDAQLAAGTSTDQQVTVNNPYESRPL